MPLDQRHQLPPETGESFAENALIKARAARELSGDPSIADDSGIEAPALGGRPGVRSARFAGEQATDEQNLSLLLRELEPAEDRRVDYVCVIAYVDDDGGEHLFDGRCEGTLAREPRGDGGFGYDPAFIPRGHRPRRPANDGRAERGREACDQPPRASRAGPCPAPLASRAGAVVIRTKTGAAGLSIASNSILIALKLAAGAVTGSIAIITEAIHSSIDLLASIIAFVSVRKADEPADREHPYGHEKLENLAAAIEGMLILVGAGIIIFEATRRLVTGAEIEELGVGIAVIGFSAVANFAVSTFLYRRARVLGSPALEGDAAHLRTDALTSVGVLVGLVLVEVTGDPAFDSIAALFVAAAIVVAGLRILNRSSRVLVDEAPPAADLDRIERAIATERARAPEIAGYHKLRARRAGARYYIDLHLQFRHGTSLERAHATAHAIRSAIETEIPRAEVLIHNEPEESVRPPEEEAQGRLAGRARTGSRPPRRRPRRRRSSSRCSR